ncbi:MAG: general secretion pathway protein GspK [Sedimentisphaerales bacterium]|nr:general secretion pathway protein GspK [Sedimentisphaerales bacterium]
MDGSHRHQRGVVLLITLVILVILSTLGYTLGARVSARRHRDRYIIDYTQAQYACMSGLKYALTSMSSLTAEAISRPNEPDFSDVFALSEPQYQALLAQMVENVDSPDGRSRSGTRGVDLNDANGPYAPQWQSAGPSASAKIPGPYGPPWPLVSEPVELEIGSVKVKIEIEDENAKYPLGWVLLKDEERVAEADVGFRTFCEWMRYQPGEFTALKENLAKVGEIRPFQMEFKPVAAPPTSAATAAAARAASLRNRVARTQTATTTARQSLGRSVISAADQMDRQNTTLARFFHSSLLDTDLLSRPTVASDSRKESALKYLGLWATRQVNVNTAPRHVLEAALTFGSVADAPRMADAIIQRRKVQPFSDVEELKRELLRYSDSIEKCKEFIVTTSTVFTVRVTAVSGVATRVALAGVTKEGSRVKTIAVISD